MSETLAGPEPAAAGPTALVQRRRRLLAVGLALGLALLIAAVTTLDAAGSATPGAARLVPADALGFVDVSLDPGSSEFQQALAMTTRLPDFGRLERAVGGRIGAVLAGGHRIDFTRQVLPWVGHEAAVALLNTRTSSADALIILNVGNAARARAFLHQEGAARRGSYRGAALYAYPSGSELAFASHFLVVGQDASVRAALDVAGGRTRSLSGSSVYQRAVASEPEHPALSAYASMAGVRRLLAPRGGILGALGDLLYQPALQGVALALVPGSGGARVLIHSALDPTLQRLGHARASFTPTLQNVLPSGAILMLDVRGLNRMAPALLSAGATAGIGGGVAALLSRLGGALRAEGVDVPAVTALFSGETAVGIVPSAGSNTLVVIARVPSMARARTQLAQLEIPLAQLFQTPNATRVPVFNDLTVAGVSDHQLALASGLELDYAVFRGLVVISTSSAGVAAVAEHTRRLAQDPGFRSVLPPDPTDVGSLVYMALPELVAVGQGTDLISGSGFRRLAPDLAAVGHAGLISMHSSGDATVRITLRWPGSRP